MLGKWISCRVNVIAVAILYAALVPYTLAQSAPLNIVSVPVTNQATVNQCSAGEPIALSGTVQVQYSLGTDTNGNNLFYVTASTNVTGIGETTAVQYAAADSEDYTLSSGQSSAEATVQLKADLVPQGGGGTAMTLVQQLQITVDTVGDLTVQLVSNSSTCGS
jgi:hypothetical protein